MRKPKSSGKPKIVARDKLTLTWGTWEDITQVSDGCVKEIEAINFLHYLTPSQRAHLANNIWRVLEMDGKAKIQVPHWLTPKYYDDNVQWPPVTEQWMWWLNKFWRDNSERADDSYKCNFHVVPVYNLNPKFATRSQEFTQFAVEWYKDAAQDIIFNLTKYPLDKEP